MSLTETEVRQLLAVAMGYDNRKPGDLNVAAWIEAARRGRWTFDLALEAVHEHYTRRAEWLMPGHITERIRAEMRQPAPLRDPATGQLPPGFEPRAIPAADDDSPAARRAAVLPLQPKRARRARLDAQTRAAVLAELNRVRPAVEPTGGEPAEGVS